MPEAILDEARTGLALALGAGSTLPEDRVFFDQAIEEIVAQEIVEQFREMWNRPQVQERVARVPSRGPAIASLVLGTPMVNRIRLRAIALKFRATGTLDPRGLPIWRSACAFGWVLAGFLVFVGVVGLSVVVIGIGALASPEHVLGVTVVRSVGILLLATGGMLLGGVVSQALYGRTNLSLARRMVRAYGTAAQGASREKVSQLLELPL